MKGTPTNEYHILNFFRVKNDFATQAEMNLYLMENGLRITGTEFKKVLDKNYLDMNSSNGKDSFRINETGLTRLARLERKYEYFATIKWIMGNPMSTAIIGGVVAMVIGTVILKLLHLL